MFAIETDRLILRDIQPEDFEAFYATTDDPEYRQFYPDSELTRPAFEGIFARILQGITAAERKSYQLAVCLKTGALAGTVGVRMEDLEHQQASFGCAIARPWWGQGIAVEAARCLIDFGFETLPIHRLYAETNSENGRARALAERVGMRLEGELRHTKYFKGRWWNTAIYALLKEDWTRVNADLR
jgi:RimJ/RimL family protein N-acetyltransferase